VIVLTRSFKRRVAATCGAALGFALLYEVTILDSEYAARQETFRETTALPAPGARLRFAATAYCKGQTTASGVSPRTGIAAADPKLLPVGSIVQLGALPQRYNGIYTVMDTGPEVRGRELDLYMWSCYEALDFGRRSVSVTVIRLGWNPRSSSLDLRDLLFRLPAPEPRPKPPLEAKPLPLPQAVMPPQ
jgi:3D (Asp-Asp-Asp) domain-containing protein